MRLFLIYFFLFFVPSLAKAEGCRLLILAGGGSKGAYQAGLLEALIEKGLRWDTVKAYSAGGFNAAFLGTSSKWEAFNESRLMWGALTNSDIYEYTFPSQSLLSSRPLRETITKLIKPRLPFKALPTTVVAVNIETGTPKMVALNAKTLPEVVDWLLASASIPLVFPPTYIRQIPYWDGQSENIGFISENPCLGRPTSITIIAPDELEIDRTISGQNLLSLTLRALKIFLDLDIKTAALGFEDVPILYCVPKEPLNISLLDFTHGEELWIKGYSSLGDCSSLN